MQVLNIVPHFRLYFLRHLVVYLKPMFRELFQPEFARLPIYVMPAAFAWRR